MMKYHSEAELNRAIIALAGKKSFGLIAQEFGITRNKVAGIIWRHKNKGKHLIRSNYSGGRKLGTGYRNGPYAPETLYG